MADQPTVNRSSDPFEFEKKNRRGKKFEEKEIRGDIFRKKLKEVDKNRDRRRRKKIDILEIGSSNKPKFDKSLENAIENLKEDSRFPQKPERKKRLGPVPKTRRMPERSGRGKAENPPKRKIGEQEEMIPLAKGGRAMYKSGGRGCKLAMKGKGRAYGKNS
jgi:hypothetical protein